MRPKAFSTQFTTLGHVYRAAMFVTRRQDLAMELLSCRVIYLFGQAVTNPVTAFKLTARSMIMTVRKQKGLTGTW